MPAIAHGSIPDAPGTPFPVYFPSPSPCPTMPARRSSASTRSAATGAARTRAEADSGAAGAPHGSRPEQVLYLMLIFMKIMFISLANLLMVVL